MEASEIWDFFAQKAIEYRDKLGLGMRECVSDDV